MKKAHAVRAKAVPVAGRDMVGSCEHKRLADRLAGRA
jgi:hypothetical protein